MAEQYWHIAFTLSGEESQAETWLLQNAGAVEGFFPSEIHWRRLPKAARNKPKKIPVIKACVPGYLFVRFRAEPDYARTKEDCRHLLGWMQIGERAIVVTESVLMQMEQVPQRMADMKERMRLAEIEARTFRPGDTAVIESGPLAGWEIVVKESSGEAIVFDTPIGVAEARRDQLRKIAG